MSCIIYYCLWNAFQTVFVVKDILHSHRESKKIIINLQSRVFVNYITYFLKLSSVVHLKLKITFMSV